MHKDEKEEMHMATRTVALKITTDKEQKICQKINELNDENYTNLQVKTKHDTYTKNIFALVSQVQTNPHFTTPNEGFSISYERL